MDVGSRIREIRQSKGMSMAMLGEKIGVSQQAIQQVESGRSGINFKTLQKIACGLGTTVKEIICDEEEKRNKYAQILTERVKAAGQEVIDRASDLVGDGELMTNFEIILHFEQDCAPEIEVVKKFINKRVVERMREE